MTLAQQSSNVKTITKVSSAKFSGFYFSSLSLSVSSLSLITRTGPTRAVTATWERTGSGGGGGGGGAGTHAVIFCCLSTFIFSSFHPSSFPIISFPTSTTTGGAQKESAVRIGRDIRGRR